LKTDFQQKEQNTVELVLTNIAMQPNQATTHQNSGKLNSGAKLSFYLRFVKSYFRLALLMLVLITSGRAIAQKHTISGYVKDAATGEFIIGAGVFIEELRTGAATNVYGFYSLTLPEGYYHIRCTFVGYQEFRDSFDLKGDKSLNIALMDNALVIKEVEVTGEKSNKNTESTEMGKIELDVETVKALPAFLGEADIMKAIQYMPGVQSAGEGNSGFYVRGGGPDQNLILLDEAVVYNASHLFGFFSVFNADAVKNVELTKGSMPANFGGRLSSVVDITMKDGNYQDYHVEGGIGLISSRLTVQGPIKKDTCSFIVSARRTYIDVLIEPFIKDSSPFKGSGYYFYDLNAKINYRFSDKDRLYLSGYFGRDVFTYANKDAGFEVRTPWGNATGSLRWNHLFSNKLFMNATAIFSDFNFAFEALQDEFEFKLLSGIRDFNQKIDFSYFPNPKHHIKFGTNYIWHVFTPSSASAKQGDVVFNTGDIQKIYAHEAAAYVLDDFTLNPRIGMNIGLRYSTFFHVGSFIRFQKDVVGNTLNETRYGPGELVQFYHGLEPRFATRFTVDEHSSIKAGVSHNYQYVHLASISSVSLPTDVWFPCSDLVKPQINTQYSAGYFRNFAKNMFETSVEIYYKDMHNLIEYREGASPQDNVNDNVDNLLVFGKGYSYGVELFIKKRTGKFNGWIGYTYSQTMRQFPDINYGEWFPAKYDRRHDASLVLTYDLNPRIKFGAVFVYATGNAITLPVGRYIYEGSVVSEYGPRNSQRMRDYHRADISVNIYDKEFKEKKDPVSGEIIKRKKKFRHNFNIAVYNLYNRANPYFIYFDTEGDFAEGTLDVSAKQVSLFPALPSVTWNFQW
jgi:hypothetical protein